MTAVAEPKSDTQQISLLTQMVRFIVVGGFSALVDFGVYNLCLHVFALDAAAHGADISRAISFICGTTTAYLLNRRWTFNADDHSKAWAFTVLYVITFFVAVVRFSGFSIGLPVLRSTLLAQFTVTNGSAISNSPVARSSV